MRHPRIVNLTDVFEICCDSFATVLGYCRGTDLECLLRERKQLPERDARALVLQVARGLQYLNTAQVKIDATCLGGKVWPCSCVRGQVDPACGTLCHTLCTLQDGQLAMVVFGICSRFV